MNGKGDSPRPVNKGKYDEEYERIFGPEWQVKERRRASIVRKKMRHKDKKSGMFYEE